jgi:NhaP-type Na+/H+ or K+/H+ antiporter
MAELLPAMGIIAAVLIVAALVSGVVDRAPISFPMIFLGLGFLLGPAGLRWIDLDVHSPLLEVVAVISLALVLFMDAVNVDIDELKADWFVPLLTLGPGTLLTIAGIAAAAHWLLGALPLAAVLLGAILASTDPVVLRDVVRDPRIPRSVRRALSVEAGMNDLIVLPIVLVLIAVLTQPANTALDWVIYLGRVLVLSPLLGLLVGAAGGWLMGKADARFHIRTEYQALYGIGLVLAAFATGQTLGGDGFLAAFFAGLAITLFNMSLCDCFLEYGEVTAEMLMFLAFVLFGAVLSTLLSTMLTAAALLPVLALAGLALFVVRPLSMGLVLLRARMSNSARLFIGWFGPRGLNSLLLALLAVQGHVPGAEWLMAVTGVVVIVSVVLHGATATPLAALYGRHVARAAVVPAEERESTFVGLFEEDARPPLRIAPADLWQLREAAAAVGSPGPTVLDVRARSSYEADGGQIPGSIRVLPDQVAEWAAEWRELHDRTRLVVAYCT